MQVIQDYTPSKSVDALNIPNAIGSKVLWLDGDDASTITESSGSVSQWSDKSGHGNHAVQAAGLDQPTYVTGAVNGRNIVRFDGLTQFLVSPDSTTLRMGTGEFGIFAVHVFNATNGKLCIKGRTAGGGSNFRRYEVFSATSGIRVRFAIDSDSQTEVSVLSESFPLSTVRATIGNKDNLNTEATVVTDESTSEVTKDTGVYDTLDETSPIGLGIGARPEGVEEMDGDICELIIVKGRAFSEQEKTLLFLYAAKKWGVS